MGKNNLRLTTIYKSLEELLSFYVYIFIYKVISFKYIYIGSLVDHASSITQHARMLSYI